MLKKFKYWLIPVILLLSGSVSWSLTMIKSGLPGKYGLGFWGPNGHDGIWHIAIAESFIRGSWGMPVFAGEMIRNYHVGYDLLLAIIHKISFIPASNLYFQVMPVATSMGIGIMCFLFVRKWRNSVFEAIGATFFTMFGGSFGWLVNFVRWHNFDGESMLNVINGKETRDMVFAFDALAEDIKMVRTKNRKLIIAKNAKCNLCKSHHHENFEEYDLEIDPEENNNVYSEKNELQEILEGNLAPKKNL